MKKRNKRIKRIAKKLDQGSREPGREGYFIRHIDGNTLNNNISNLTKVHPFEAFSNSAWKVDWVLFVDDVERIFVIANMESFAAYYKFRFQNLQRQ